MTPQEFKAWFDGFTEAFTGMPTKAQWARVKERVGEIDGKPVTERVFVDRYWPNYNTVSWPVYRQPYFTAYCGNANAAVALSNSTGQAGMASSFSSTQAMNALGHADAVALNG